MRKRLSVMIAGLAAITMLGGCGMIDTVKDTIAEKTGSMHGDKDVSDEDKETGTKPKAEQDSPDSLALLGDLMGENLGSAAEGKPDGQAPETDDTAVQGDADAAENQIVVTQADEWQGFYYGTIHVIGFGDDYEGMEADFEGYAIVRKPEDDHPFMEIYSDDFDIWSNVDFSYNGQALASMYVELSDDTLLPVVYESGDAYIIDATLTDKEVQAFRTTSDGKTPARIRAEYNYYDPELAQDNKSGGMLILFDLTKETIY